MYFLLTQVYPENPTQNLITLKGTRFLCVIKTTQKANKIYAHFAKRKSSDGVDEIRGIFASINENVFDNVVWERFVKYLFSN